MKTTILGALKSKTVWFNVISAVLAVVGALNGVLAPEAAALITAVGNIAIRFLTTQPLSAK